MDRAFRSARHSIWQHIASSQTDIDKVGSHAGSSVQDLGALVLASSKPEVAVHKTVIMPLIRRPINVVELMLVLNVHCIKYESYTVAFSTAGYKPVSH